MEFDEFVHDADILDSRDLAEKVREIEAELIDDDQETNEDDKLDPDDRDLRQRFLDAVSDLKDEAGEWEYGETFIHEDYWSTYVQELATDVTPGLSDAINDWPYSHIDWDAAAEALKVDYMSTTFGGDTYYFRNH